MNNINLLHNCKICFVYVNKMNSKILNFFDYHSLN